MSGLPDSPRPEEGRAHVKRMVMKPPCFSGKGSVRTFLAKFDNCRRYNRWSDREKLHYFTNALEDPAAQVLWDLQSEGAVSYRDLRASLVQVYGSEGQAEVFRAQLKMVRRKKGESLTDLAMKIRRLMVMAFPRPMDRTIEIVARDVFLDALDDPELTFQIHTQRPRELDSAVQIAQYLEAVIRSLPSRSSKSVRTVVHDGGEGKLAAELKDLRPGQRYLLDALEQFGERLESRPNKQQVSDTRPQAALPTDWADRRASEGDGRKQARRNTACFACEKEGHYAKNCDQVRSKPRGSQMSATGTPSPGAASVRKNSSVRFRGRTLGGCI